MDWPKIEETTRIARLEAPRKRPIAMVLDTDTYNEVDDQFALAYALLEGSFDVQAVYAAPFHNSRSEGPEDGMERSYKEIHKLLDLMDLPKRPAVLRGSKQYMEGTRYACGFASSPGFDRPCNGSGSGGSPVCGGHRLPC